MIAGRVVATAHPDRFEAQNILAQIVQSPTHAASQGFKIRDGKHHLAPGLRDSGHLGDSRFRGIKMIHRPLANTGVEAPFGKGQPI